MLYYLTSNPVKLDEAKAYFPGIVDLKQDLDEIQSLDPIKVVHHKLDQLKTLDLPEGEYIVDDFSFGLDCLNGFPGTMVKWFEEALGDGAKYYLQICEAYGNFQAKATCSVGWTNGNKNIISSFSISGNIVEPRPGVGSGCYTIFVPNGSDKTFSQMTAEERNAIGPRAMCFKTLKPFTLIM